MLIVSAYDDYSETDEKNSCRTDRSIVTTQSINGCDILRL